MYKISCYFEGVCRAEKLVLEAGGSWPYFSSEVLEVWAMLQNMFCCLLSCPTGALWGIHKLESVVHMFVEAVVACSQPKDADLLRSFESMIAIPKLDRAMKSLDDSLCLFV